MRDLRKLSGSIVVIVFLLIMQGCGKADKTEEREIVAYVNSDPIFASEIKKDMDIKCRYDSMCKRTPEAAKGQLETIIDKKIIIQAAMKAGLAREEKFVDTIKTFWEQTLIRDFISFKNKGLKQDLSVSDEEVMDYYNNLGQRVLFKVLKSRDKDYINKVLEQIKSGSQAKDASWEIIGPVGYQDISTDALLDVFKMPVGEVRVINDSPDYYLVEMLRKDDVTLRPLEEVRPEIESTIKAMKERKLFDEWLKGQRKKADIKIINK